MNEVVKNVSLINFHNRVIIDLFTIKKCRQTMRTFLLKSRDLKELLQPIGQNPHWLEVLCQTVRIKLGQMAEEYSTRPSSPNRISNKTAVRQPAVRNCNKRSSWPSTNSSGAKTQAISECQANRITKPRIITRVTWL